MGTRSPWTTSPARSSTSRPTARSSSPLLLPELETTTRGKSRSTGVSLPMETTPSLTTSSRPRSPLPMETDWDLSTPWNMKMNLNAKGKGPRWGDWSVARDVNFSTADKILELSVDGHSHFTKGNLATSAPILAQVDLKSLSSQHDLQGKF